MLKPILFGLLVFILFSNVLKVQCFVDVTDLNCQFNEDICGQKICSKSVSKSRIKVTFVNAGCFLLKPVDHASMRITLYQQSKNIFEPFLLNMEEDICNIIRNTVQNPIVTQTFHGMIDRLHGIRCPLIGNVTVSKLPILLNLPSGIFPDSKYKIAVRLHKGGNFLFAINITFNKNKGRLL